MEEGVQASWKIHNLSTVLGHSSTVSRFFLSVDPYVVFFSVVLQQNANREDERFSFEDL